MVSKRRVFLFEDDESIKKMLSLMLNNNKCEISTFKDPSFSQLYQSNECQCNENEVCADIIIADSDTPHVTGLDFIERKVKQGCKVKNFAIISGFLTNKDIKRAKNLGIAIFYKPAFFIKISEWIDICFEEDKR